MACESLFSPADFEVQNLTATVFEGTTAPPPGTPTSGIIRTSQEWGVLVEWDTAGNLVSYVQGDWELNVWAESIGPGQEVRLPVPGPTVVPLHPGASPQHYRVELNFAPGAISPPVPPGSNTALYEIATSLTASFVLKPAPLACNTQDTRIQFYVM